MTYDVASIAANARHPDLADLLHQLDEAGAKLIAANHERYELEKHLGPVRFTSGVQR